MRKYLSFYPTLTQSWLLVAIFIIVGQILAGIVVGIPAEFIELGDYKDLLINIVAYTPLALFIVIQSKDNILKAEATGIPIDYVKMSDPVRGRFHPIFIYLLLIPATLAMSIVGDFLISWLPQAEWYKEAIENMLGKSFIFSFIGTALWAPILEELFCRGIIMRGLLQHTTPKKAILWSSFIFAFIHLNLWQAVPAFIVGLFLGWTYYKTKSIWVPIFIHFVNNFTALILSRLYPDMDSSISLFEGMPVWQIIIIILVCITIIYNAILIIRKNYETIISD